jgi:hypothetical protein
VVGGAVLAVVGKVKVGDGDGRAVGCAVSSSSWRDATPMKAARMSPMQTTIRTTGM